MDPKQPDFADLANDPDRLAEHLVKELGPRIARSLRRLYGPKSANDLDGTLDEAAVRVLARGDLAELTQKDVDRLFFGYCRVVARETFGEERKRRERGERSLPIEKLQRLAAASRARPRDGSPGEGNAIETPAVHRLRNAFNSLSERDRAILFDLVCPIDNQEAGGSVAAEFGLGKKALRRARDRARKRLQKAYQRFAEESGPEPPPATK